MMKSSWESLETAHGQSVCLPTCVEQGSIASEAAALDWLRIAEDNPSREWVEAVMPQIQREYPQISQY